MTAGPIRLPGRNVLPISAHRCALAGCPRARAFWVEAVPLDPALTFHSSAGYCPECTGTLEGAGANWHGHPLRIVRITPIAAQLA